MSDHDERIENLRVRANALFKDGDYTQAIAVYTKAIELDNQHAGVATLLSNRSAAHLKAGDAEKALIDAQMCTKLRPNWEKGHYRQGAALEELGQVEQALMAFEVSLSFDQNNRELISKVRQMKQTVKREKEAATAAEAERLRQSFKQRINVTTHEPTDLQAGPPDPSDWARGLPPAKQAEWLVDCYRMRVDDDYCWGGGYLHGLYDLDTSVEMIAEDFLIFCKLAVQNSVIPAGWSWAKCLDEAAKLLPYAFEKADAKEKWGRENIFSGMLFGGRSLRYTGEVVYGFSCLSPADWSGRETAGFRSMRSKLKGFRGWQGLMSEGCGVFDDVGGVELWKQLHSRLFIPRGNF